MELIARTLRNVQAGIPYWLTASAELNSHIFFWDTIPLDGAEESILRFDQIQPIGHHHQSIEVMEHCLTDKAMRLLDEWWTWAVTDLLDYDGDLFKIRQFIADEFKSSA